jgi:predicted TIM-barrel fold metal-dependent hydrolase
MTRRRKPGLAGATTEPSMPLDLIAIEEHFWTPELKALRPPELVRDVEHTKRLDDLGELRIAEMDTAGIDMQVLSETAPAVHNMDPDKAVPLARRSNDFLHQATRSHADRFAGFASLPVADPKAAADELERAVTKLGFKGAMFMGLCKGRFLDEKFFWPIFERAQVLDVPVYLHPSRPHPAVLEAYYKAYPALIGPSLGFGNEVLTMALRLVVGGVLDAHPKLKVLIGHLGEGLPFLQWRTDRSLTRDAELPRSFTDYVRQHFWVTTSGAFSDAALRCSIEELGIDKVIFSVDYPYVNNDDGRRWFDAAPISAQERQAIASGNVKKLLKL